MNESLKRHKQLQNMMAEFKQAKFSGTKDLIRLLTNVTARFAKENEIQGEVTRQSAEDRQDYIPIRMVRSSDRYARERGGGLARG